MITLQDIKAVHPCWRPERLEARVPSAGATWSDIAKASDVSVQDRRWLLTQLAVRTREGRSLLVLWAAGCAQDVVHLIPDGDLKDASLNCIAAAAAWAQEPSAARAADAADAADAARAARAAAATYAAADAADAAAAAAAYATRADKQLLDLAANLENAGL